MDSELARAYNNLADPHKPTCKEMLKKALALLKPHVEYFEDDYYWNFRMGYSYLDVYKRQPSRRPLRAMSKRRSAVSR